ncbi:MAG TPA: ABC transporter permease subunit, partial [Acidobacteriota bacterium]|nr:ABC transporter permease subunit [Acidobacteriota bacterium]
ISQWNFSRASESKYKQDPVLMLFGELDLTFVCGVILSLFAILFSYGAVSGEKERGTLQLIISNSVKRTSVILGKLIGLFFPLVLILLVPLLLSIAMLMLAADFTLSPNEWLRLAAMTGSMLLYLLVFLLIGLAGSALTRNSFNSFVLCLLVWVCSVVVIPKIMVHVAQQVSPSMSYQEYIEIFRKFRVESRHSYERLMREYLQNHPMKEEDFRQRSSEVFEAVNNEINKEREEFFAELTREQRRRRQAMLNSATALASISPTSCLDFALHSLSNTGPQMLEMFEESLDNYRRDFMSYAESVAEKYEEEADLEGMMSVRVGRDKDGYVEFTFNEGASDSKLDLAGMPVFAMRLPGAPQMIARALPWLLALALMAVIFFAAAYVAFLRYDVR